MADSKTTRTSEFLQKAQEWAAACEFNTISAMLSALIERDPKKIIASLKNLFTSVGTREAKSFKDRYGVDIDDIYTEVIISSSSAGADTSSSSTMQQEDK
jgi:cytidylate kinase